MFQKNLNILPLIWDMPELYLPFRGFKTVSKYLALRWNLYDHPAQLSAPQALFALYKTQLLRGDGYPIGYFILAVDGLRK